jgi:hypothetical protein
LQADLLAYALHSEDTAVLRLAIGVEAERYHADSFWAPYFDTLPESHVMSFSSPLTCLVRLRTWLAVTRTWLAVTSTRY